MKRNDNGMKINNNMALGDNAHGRTCSPLLLAIVCFLFGANSLSAQQHRVGSDYRDTSLSLVLIEQAEVDMVFNTFQSYQLGQTIMNAVVLGVIAEGTNWNLSVMANTEDSLEPDEWEQVLAYAGHGSIPKVEDMELRFRNLRETSVVTGFFPLRPANDPVYIIPETATTIDCPDQGTNAPGSYLVNPECYRFRVDYRFTPDYSMQPGLYRLLIEYTLVSNL